MVSPAYRQIQQTIEQVFEKQFFFVMGVLKSGTTWLQFLLDAHPEICCKGEGHFIDELCPKLYESLAAYNSRSKVRARLFAGGGLDTPAAYINKKYFGFVLATIIGLIFARWAEGTNVKCIGDKTPHNIHALGLLGAMFPAAKYIHIIRDGRDAATAMWMRNFQRNREATLKQFGNFEYFVEDFAKKWTQGIKSAQECSAANPDRYFELRYEDLHREPEPIVRGLFEFLGVDAGDAVVTDCIGAASFKRLTGGRKRGQEQPGAFMRKGVIGDWRNHFDEVDRATFQEHAGTLLKELGYDD